MEEQVLDNFGQEEKQKPKKVRHFLLTIWLVLVAGYAVVRLFEDIKIFRQHLIKPEGTEAYFDYYGLVASLLRTSFILFAYLIFRWKKIGFWGYFTAQSGLFIMANFVTGIFPSGIINLFGMLITYHLLTLKSRGISGWAQLE
ncbi:MAG: hypothetical protein AAFX87_20085 [Bacteroidota bacterium]